MTEPLEDLQVLVIDCQTTGSNARQHHLVEMGWLPIRASEIEDANQLHPQCHLVQLPRNQPLPRHIIRLTGIRAEAMHDAVLPETVWHKLRKAAAAVMRANRMKVCPTVIHFARFEMAFLDRLSWQYGTGPRLFGAPICTHRIANRLYADLPRKGLRAVAGYLGHSVTMQKRCIHHIRATAIIWRTMLRHLESLHGLTTEGALRAWLDVAPFPVKRPRIYPIDHALPKQAPDRPGVYRFHRTNGDLLYIGKAANLKTRLNSYFQKSRRHTERTLEMLSQAVHLDYNVTASALEAALLETDAIKHDQPPYNHALAENARKMVFFSKQNGIIERHSAAHPILGPVPACAPLEAFCNMVAVLAVLEDGTPIQAPLKVIPGPENNAPDQPILAQGIALFKEKHAAVLQTSRPVWASLLRIANGLWIDRRHRLAADAQEASRSDAPESQPAASDVEGGMDWTPEAVMRSIESNVCTCGFLLRRSRWLAMLSESSVAWAASGLEGESKRLLIFTAGGVHHRAVIHGHADIPVPPGYRTSRQQRQMALDLKTYDRLRVLTTEIRRILNQQRPVYVRLNVRGVLGPVQLRRMLWWI